MALEDRTARLTILIDPRKKALFERLCAAEDAAASQVVRRLIRRYVAERVGTPWVAAQTLGMGIAAFDETKKAARHTAQGTHARRRVPRQK